MRLLDTNTGQFVEKDPQDQATVYAILSHTWDTKQGEQTYKELEKIQQRYVHESQALHARRPDELEGRSSSLAEHGRNGLSPDRAPKSIWDDPELSPKIREACSVARKNGYRYIWIDSCCIDKSSSSELSEAINSMYKWYGLSVVCYAYLADVPAPEGVDRQKDSSLFCESRWFTRGWTLQELIAPLNVEFLSQDWAHIGSKHTLAALVESATDIHYTALLHLDPLDAFSVAQRLSWAARRKTTREEDRAYSLMGIFDINMPTLYGEGDRAFQRLQEHITQRIPDQSLFAWGFVYLLKDFLVPCTVTSVVPADQPLVKVDGDALGLSLSAPSLDSFRNCGKIRSVHLPASHRHMIAYTSTPYGIRVEFQMIPITHDLLSAILPYKNIEMRFLLQGIRWYLAILGCEHTDQPGQPLGQVCYVPTTSKSQGIDFVYSGYIMDNATYDGTVRSLFPIPLDVVERFRPETELKVVYIRRRDSANLLSRVRKKREYAGATLVLPKATRDALRDERGYSAELRRPASNRDTDHLGTTHWLTLSRPEHATIIVEFRDHLEADSKEVKINATVGIRDSQSQSGSSGVSLDSQTGAVPEGCRTASWSQSLSSYDYSRGKLGVYKITLRSATGPSPLAVMLGLEFVGAESYVLYIDVVGDGSLATSAV